MTTQLNIILLPKDTTKVISISCPLDIELMRTDERILTKRDVCKYLFSRFHRKDWNVYDEDSFKDETQMFHIYYQMRRFIGQRYYGSIEDFMAPFVDHSRRYKSAHNRYFSTEYYKKKLCEDFHSKVKEELLTKTSVP